MSLEEFECQIVAAAERSAICELVTVGWHYHPFGDPDRHVWLSQAMSFGDFLGQVEQNYS